MMSKIGTVEGFREFVDEVEAAAGYVRPLAFGIGVATRDSKGKVIEVYYPCPNYQSSFGTAAVLSRVAGYVHDGGAMSGFLELDQINSALDCFSPFLNEPGHVNVEVLKTVRSALVHGGISRAKIVVTFIGASSTGQVGPSKSVADAYLRLHLLSHRLVKPGGIDLEGIFDVLDVLAWTNEGPVALHELAERQLSARLDGRLLHVNSVDKYPWMLDYVVPSDVRIGDGAVVELGAYIEEGVIVTCDGSVPFNAGPTTPGVISRRLSVDSRLRTNS